MDILSRYIKFFEGLKQSTSYEVIARFLQNDIRSTTGKNVRLLKNLSGAQSRNFSEQKVKDVLTSVFQRDVPETDIWRIRYLYSLISQRRSARETGLKDEEQRIQELIKCLVKN